MGSIILYVIIFILIALITSDAGIKPKMFKYLNLFICSIFAVALTFNSYETVGNLLISKGILPGLAYSLCFLLIFAIALAILWSIAQFIIREDMPFSLTVLRAVNIGSSVLFCLVLIGVIYVGLGLAPSSSSFPYAHFPKDANISPQNIDQNSKSSLLALDKMVSSLFRGFSSGSLSGGNNFKDLHPNYLDTIYFNKATVKDGSLTLAGDKAISLPTNFDQIIKKAPISLKDQDGNPVKPSTGQKSITMNLLFSKYKFEDGGALDEENSLILNTGQIRILCKLENGSVCVVYPQGYLSSPAVLQRKSLTEPITYLQSDFGPKGTLGITLLYQIPENSQPYALAFRENVIKVFPKPIKKKDSKPVVETPVKS